MGMLISSAPSSISVDLVEAHGASGSPLAIPVAGLSVNRNIDVIAKFSANPGGISFYTHHTDASNTNHGSIAAAGQVQLRVRISFDGTNILVCCTSSAGAAASQVMLSVAPTAGKTVDAFWIYSISGGQTCDYSAQIVEI